MAKINHYITMLLFVLMFLVGLQIPAFMDQYTKRVDAQLVESSRSLRPYKQIADKYHEGNIEALIQLHRQSDRPSFIDEADAIQSNVTREKYLLEHLQLLNKNLFSAAATMLLHVDEEIYDRTYNQFTMSIQFTKVSLVFAAFMAVLSCAIYELVQFLIKRITKKIIDKKMVHKKTLPNGSNS